MTTTITAPQRSMRITAQERSLTITAPERNMRTTAQERSPVKTANFVTTWYLTTELDEYITTELGEYILAEASTVGAYAITVPQRKLTVTILEK